MSPGRDKRDRKALAAWTPTAYEPRVAAGLRSAYLAGIAPAFYARLAAVAAANVFCHAMVGRRWFVTADSPEQAAALVLEQTGREVYHAKWCEPWDLHTLPSLAALRAAEAPGRVQLEDLTTDRGSAPPQYEIGDHVQLVGDPSHFGIVDHLGFREHVSGEPRWPPGPAGYVPSPEALSRYGYVIRVRWGGDAFTRWPMDRRGDEMPPINTSKIERAAQEASELLASLADPKGWKWAGPDALGHALVVGLHRFKQLSQALTGPLVVRGHFPSQDSHRAMQDCADRGWLRAVMKGSFVGSFEITRTGRKVVERLRDTRVAADAVLCPNCGADFDNP